MCQELIEIYQKIVDDIPPERPLAKPFEEAALQVFKYLQENHTKSQDDGLLFAATMQADEGNLPKGITKRIIEIWKSSTKTVHALAGAEFHYVSFDNKRVLHRVDGPAAVYDGRTLYYFNGELHRTDGPALIDAFGNKRYYLNGIRHRLNGPAVEYAPSETADGLLVGKIEFWEHGTKIENNLTTAIYERI